MAALQLPVSKRISAPAPVAWDLLTQPVHWPRWGPTVLDARLDSGATRITEGATGQVRVPPGVWLPFEVTHLDEGRSWSWAVAGVPATGHRVAPTAKGCRVTFTMPWWAPAYAAVCLLALRRIETLAAEAED